MRKEIEWKNEVAARLDDLGYRDSKHIAAEIANKAAYNDIQYGKETGKRMSQAGFRLLLFSLEKMIENNANKKQ